MSRTTIQFCRVPLPSALLVLLMGVTSVAAFGQAPAAPDFSSRL